MALIATSFKLLMLSVVIIVCGAVFNVPQLAFGQTEQAGKVTGSYKGTPKERFREAERLVKEGNLYGAFEEYQGAATAEPNNKKYLEKLTNISKVVSANALSNGIRQMAVAPDKAVDWLQRALRYNSANYTAAVMLGQVKRNISDAVENSNKAQVLLDTGDLNNARTIIASIQTYSKAAPEVASVQTELAAADIALQAQKFWRDQKPDVALEELSRAEVMAPSSKFVRGISDIIRGGIADNLLTKVSSLPTEDSKQLFEKLLMARDVLRVQPENMRAKAIEKQISEGLTNSLLARNELAIKSDKSPGIWRIVGERLKVTRSLGDADTRLSEEMAAAESKAYPRFRVRLIVAEPEKCKKGPIQEEIRTVLDRSLRPVAQLSDTNWDLTLTIRDLNCSSTDIPKQSAEQVNSTFVVGYTQLANPEYARLQENLQSAEMALNRAVYANSINPNFGTAFALGLAQGRVRNIRSQMAKTEPFKSQPIVQQHLYEKFVAYRAFEVAARVQVSAPEGTQEIATQDYGCGKSLMPSRVSWQLAASSSRSKSPSGLSCSPCRAFSRLEEISLREAGCRSTARDE